MNCRKKAAPWLGQWSQHSVYAVWFFTRLHGGRVPPAPERVLIQSFGERQRQEARTITLKQGQQQRLTSPVDSTWKIMGMHVRGYEKDCRVRRGNNSSP